MPDYRSRVARHREIAESHYADPDPRVRAICEAFQAGVKRFMQQHPKQAPAWAPKLAPWQIPALGHYIIWGWPEGVGRKGMRRATCCTEVSSPIR